MKEDNILKILFTVKYTYDIHTDSILLTLLDRISYILCIHFIVRRK